MGEQQQHHRESNKERHGADHQGGGDEETPDRHHQGIVKNRPDRRVHREFAPTSRSGSSGKETTLTVSATTANRKPMPARTGEHMDIRHSQNLPRPFFERSRGS